MAHQCLKNEYFDSLLNACISCYLRCFSITPAICENYCNSVHYLSDISFNSVKGSSTILWTCFGLSVLLSLTVFVLVFLLRKRRSPPLKDEFKSTGSALQKEANADMDGRKDSRTGEEILPRSLEYTVEECTCEDCAKSQPHIDSDHFFPLPAMEEGATVLVTTKTNDYCNGLQAAGCITRMEKSISTR
ncbi:TNF receptor superfamily member 17 [Phyllostomus discolor]|uniref:TNF receptor superfamily member 17 n=1 Tax=Phyllostomus discolor TaxID=89673 RepID=A0A834BC31_9CHIR|nr:TNF receptor superfamily member 17 [Phyllostomus discolor]